MVGLGRIFLVLASICFYVACGGTSRGMMEENCSDDGGDCTNDVRTGGCNDTCDCPVGFGCTDGTCQIDEDASHSACGGGSFTVTMTLYGPPAEYVDLDPFKNCDFVKSCYQLVGESKLRDCVTHESPGITSGDSFTLSALPDGVKLNVVAACYDTDPMSSTPQPGYVRSRGKSQPVTGTAGGSAEVYVYMTPPASFGPSCSREDGQRTVTTPSFPRWGATATELYDGTILIAGGVDELVSGCSNWSDPGCITKTLLTAAIYDPGSGIFSLVGTSGSSQMPQGSAFAAAVRLPSEQVAIFGGISATGIPTDTVTLYDPVARTFAAVESGRKMLDSRSRFTATLISSAEGGFVLLVGGYGTGEATWELWTPTSGTIASGSLAESRWNHTATLVTKEMDPMIGRDVVILIGGEGEGEPGSTTVRDSMEIFDIDATQLDPMPIALCSNLSGNSPPARAKTMHATAFVPARHFLYIAGGFEDGKHEEPMQDICVWHTAQEKWAGEAGTFRLKTGRGALTATTLPGNAVLFSGGLIISQGDLHHAEAVEIVFEYVNGNTDETVVDIGPGDGFEINMLSPRWDHRAIYGSDGKVLIFGGISGEPSSFSPVEFTELFNPHS